MANSYIPHEGHGLIEEKGIQAVSVEETHGSPKSTFGLWMAANVQFGTLTTGALATGYLGLSFHSALLAIVVANLLGSIALAVLSTFGVDYGLPQMIQGANWYGKNGNRLPSFFNFLSGASWFAVITISGAYALQYFIGGSIAVSVLVLCTAQIAIAFFGHDFIQATEKYVVYLLVIGFVLLSFFAVQNLGLSFPENVKAQDAVGGFAAAFIMCVSIMLSYVLGWVPFSSDYTRYLHTDKNNRDVKRLVLSYAFWGSFISTVWMEALGALIGASVSFVKPSDLFTAWMPAWFKIPFLIAVVLGTMSANILNIYSATLSILAVGFKTKQHVAAIVTGGIGTLISILAATDFLSNYENFLLVFGYWASPWATITLLCHFTNRASRSNRISGAFLAWIATLAASWPFYNQTLYVGPFASAFPQFGDCTLFVSSLLAVTFYFAFTASGRREGAAMVTAQPTR